MFTKWPEGTEGRCEARTDILMFLASWSLTTPFQKSDLYTQCQQGGLKQGQPLQKRVQQLKVAENCRGRDCYPFAAVSLQSAYLEQDTTRRT